MIAASAVLVVVALILLIVGVFQTGLELVFASIAASIVAAISLFWGVLKDRRAPAGVPGYPTSDGASVGGIATDVPAPQAPTFGGALASDEAATDALSESAARDEAPLLLPDDTVAAEPTLTLPEIPEEPAAPAKPARAKKPAARKKAAAKKPAAKKAAAKKPAAKKPAAKKPAAKKPAAKKPAAKKPAAKKPAAKKKAAAKKPAAKKTAAKKTTGS